MDLFSKKRVISEMAKTAEKRIFGRLIDDKKIIYITGKFIEQNPNSGANSSDIERLKASFAGACEVITAGGTAEGLKLLLSDKDCDMHYAVGSLYLVGEIKALYQEGT